MIKTSCPPPEMLTKYVLGSMNHVQMQALEQHLIECQSCCEQAETLNPSDEVTKAFGLPGQSSGPDDEIVQDVIRRVSKLRVFVSETVTIATASQATGFDNPLQTDFKPADLLGPPGELGRLGDYRILKVLGSGGMGFVFLAEDQRLRRRVALKVMKSIVASKEGAKERFLREARAAAAVEHDNVVTIHQVGEDRGIPFIAMPMLQGGSLKTVLERESSLPQERAMAICRQTAAGLFAAHQAGLIHRDIKPDNLWIESPKERVKILDFGLVRELGSEDGLTISGAVLGTPSFMSPEQAEGMPVDHRSDLFSLGSVLYQMLSGCSPFAGPSLTNTLLNVVRAAPVPIQTLVPELDSELLKLISKLLSRDPADRPQTAEEVVCAIENIESRLANAKTNPSPKIPAFAFETKQVSKPSKVAKPPQRPRYQYYLAGGAAAALLLAIVFFVRIGKYPVQITLDDPTIVLKVDGEDVLIEDGQTVTRLSAGPHKLSVSRDGFATMTEEFKVEKGGKTAIHVSIVDGSLLIGNVATTPSGLPAQATLIDGDSPEVRAAKWMRSQNPPFALSLMSKLDANTQWRFSPESTDPLPEGPYRLFSVTLQHAFTNKHRDATADQLAAPIKGIRELWLLYLSSDYMTNAGVAKLVALPELADLTMIQVTGPQFDDQVFPLLTKLSNLTHVHFSMIPKMTGAGIGILSDCPKLKAVAWTNALPSVQAFEEIAKFPLLNELELNTIQCTEQHAIAIAKLSLRNLSLYNSGLNDSMLEHLSQLTQLEYLNISISPITDAGLLKLRTLKALRELRVVGTLVTPEGVAEFRKALPNCQLDTDWGKTGN